MKKLNVLVYDSISKEVVAFLKESYDVTILKYTKDAIEDVDLVILNGEEKGDISPEKYSELTGKFTNVRRSYWESYDALRGMFRYAPVLAIEDGADFINVQSGGTMIQHVVGHDKPHAIEVLNSSRNMTAPSGHHQMMYPYDLPSDKYKVLAWSKYFQSSTYLNGRNEEKELSSEFLEPEIIHFNNGSLNALAIQGNPAEGTKEYKAYCLILIDKLLRKRL